MAGITYAICSFVSMGIVLTFVIRFVICIFLPNMILYLFYKKDASFKDAVVLADNMTKGKLKLKKIIK